MKQLIIATGESSASTSNAIYDYTTIDAGKFALIDLATHKRVAYNTNLAGTDKKLALVLGAASGKMPFVISEIDCKSLTIVEGAKQAGTTYAATLTVPTPVVGQTYTIVVVKLGVGFNKRNKYTASTIATAGDTAITVATRLTEELSNKFIGNISDVTFNLTVSNMSSGQNPAATAAIKFTGTVVGEGYEVLGADALLGVAPTSVTIAKPNVLDKAYVQDLASQCAAGKGFNFTYADGDSIYPAYPEAVSASWYAMKTLRFAVPRASAKTRDEVVNQIVHICTPDE